VEIMLVVVGELLVRTAPVQTVQMEHQETVELATMELVELLRLEQRVEQKVTTEMSLFHSGVLVVVDKADLRDADVFLKVVPVVTLVVGAVDLHLRHMQLARELLDLSQSPMLR